MPLIIITGYPTSGKTHRAHQLHAYLLSRITSSANPNISNLRVHLISDHTLSIPRSVYNLDSKGSNERSNNASEKDARATIYAAVKRVLSERDIVVLDGGNYIKGWRYQLFCEAKAVRTPSCVVHVGTGVEGARVVNEGRLLQAASSSDEQSTAEEKEVGKDGETRLKREEGLPYKKDCWENLVFRYEEPNAMARWDSPLFTVLWDDEAPPGAEIWEAIIGSEEGGRKIVRSHNATVLKPVRGEDFLYELDKSTQGILNQILQWAKDHPGEGGGEVSVGEGEEELVVELPPNPVGLPALQRLRRQFITLNRQSAVPVKRIKESFVGYLNASFESA